MFQGRVDAVTQIPGRVDESSIEIKDDQPDLFDRDGAQDPNHVSSVKDNGQRTVVSEQPLVFSNPYEPAIEQCSLFHCPLFLRRVALGLFVDLSGKLSEFVVGFAFLVKRLLEKIGNFLLS